MRALGLTLLLVCASAHAQPATSRPKTSEFAVAIAVPLVVSRAIADALSEIHLNCGAYKITE